jgi:VWFA-related protein
MRLTFGYSLSVLILGAVAFSADADLVLHKRVSEVQLNVVAVDASGRPSQNLTPADLSIADEGQAVTDFQLRRAADLPLQVAIVLDRSESTSKSWPMVRAALLDSLRDVVRPGDKILLVTFNSKIESEIQMDALENLAQALPASAGGLTALYDSVYTVCRTDVFRAPEARRSAVILFSDGEDNLSYRPLGDAIAQAQRSGVAIYSVSTHKPKQHLQGDAVLHEVARHTGGRDFAVKDERGLRSALQTIAEELRDSYLVFYRAPADSALGFRHVDVLPRQANGTRLRTRTGYYVTP